MLACKNNRPLLIDAKLCKTDVFQMIRIEDNQKWAMRKFLDAGNENSAYFAIKYERHDEIYFLSYEFMAAFKDKALHYKEAKENGILLKRGDSR